jgi:hypothetical protein
MAYNVRCVVIAFPLSPNMNNPFSDDAVGFDLVTLPENVAVLLVLHQPGTKHEIDGRRLLVNHGVEERLARFAETHSTWKRDTNCTLEDLLVALADTCWKGVRSEKLEDMVCQWILAQVQAERWEVFAALDAAINDLAADGDRRLAWQSQY